MAHKSRWIKVFICHKKSTFDSSNFWINFLIINANRQRTQVLLAVSCHLVCPYLSWCVAHEKKKTQERGGGGDWALQYKKWPLDVAVSCQTLTWHLKLLNSFLLINLHCVYISWDTIALLARLAKAEPMTAGSASKQLTSMSPSICSARAICSSLSTSSESWVGWRK